MKKLLQLLFPRTTAKIYKDGGKAGYKQFVDLVQPYATQDKQRQIRTIEITERFWKYINDNPQFIQPNEPFIE